MTKTLNQLQAKDFQKWIRRQVRQNGRKAEVASEQYSAVEMWLRDLGFERVTFLSGGEIEVNGEAGMSEFLNCGYYMFDEDGQMELGAGRWLDIALLEEPEAYLIAR